MVPSFLIELSYNSNMPQMVFGNYCGLYSALFKVVGAEGRSICPDPDINEFVNLWPYTRTGY